MATSAPVLGGAGPTWIARVINQGAARSASTAGNNNGTREEKWKKHERELAERFVYEEFFKEKRISIKEKSICNSALKLILKARFLPVDAPTSCLPPSS